MLIVESDASSFRGRTGLEKSRQQPGLVKTVFFNSHVLAFCVCSWHEPHKGSTLLCPKSLGK